MIYTEPPHDWLPPKWHADYGDPIEELDRLRDLAIAISGVLSNVICRLEIPEPGLMFITVELPNGMVAEIHFIRATKKNRRHGFGVFVSPDGADEDERYFDSIKSTVKFLATETESGQNGTVVVLS